jgi:hypothetical protein
LVKSAPVRVAESMASEKTSVYGIGLAFVGEELVVANDVTAKVWYANLMTPLPPARPP